MFSPTVKRRVKKLLLWTEILVILVIGAGMGVVLGVFYQTNKLLPQVQRLDHYRAPVGTTIWSADGVKLAELASEYRDPVPLDQIPPVMQQAIVAIEDSRFYQHGGIDYIGVTRSLWANIRGQEMAQGGSTITQQLARNMFLTKKKRVSRKVKEVLLAVEIERNWTKHQILEAYLNQVYFGAGAYGVEAASQTYFGKTARKLTLEEAAMLAGLVQRPSGLSPYAAYRSDHNYKRTKTRRDMVLERMADLKFITRDKADAAKKTPIKVVKEHQRTTGLLRAKYFAQYVVDQLRDQLKYDPDYIEKGGLKVITTLNWKMQRVAERVCKEQRDKFRHSYNVSEDALVCIDPHTGYIRAMVGGVNQPWEKFQFNCATQAKRQPGSSFKAFVYTAAFEQGDTPNTGVSATAAVPMPDGTLYAPHNHGHAAGYMSYEQAFAASVNGAAVNVAVKRGRFEGPHKVKEIAQRMGLKGDIRAYPAIALGTSEATVLEMASAYGVFPAKGKLATPIAIAQVRSREDEVLEDIQPQLKDTGLKASTIEYMDELTRAVVEYGTGTAARSVPDAHGKTGTTEDYTNAWFIGYTPDLCTAVWAGNRDNSPMRNVYGATICVPIWTQFMQEAIKLNPSKKHQGLPQVVKVHKPRHLKPATMPVAAPITADGNDSNIIRVTVCAESNELPTANCPQTVTREFILGEQPQTRCTLHPANAKPSKKKKKKPEPPTDETTAAASPPATAGTTQ